MMNFRIGHGYDVHALAQGLPLWLGGIRIEHALGCVAHSDGDVLIHALCDALLGAAAIGDIGLHFPDTSEAYKGIDSKILLRRTVELIGRQGYAIGNVDCTLCLQRPKSNRTFQPCAKRWPRDGIARKPYRQGDHHRTPGFVGREEGIEAAVALIFKP
ncbi:MAG: 2-C-methyl-D-erythritol 2,4-cyclodiphosphate synthase [Alistipes sp.]